MKSISAFFLLYLFLIGSIHCQRSEENFFQGEVHFNVSATSLDDRIPQDVLELEMGTTMIGKVKRNKYLMYQNSNSKFGNSKMIFLLEEGIGYIEYEKSDTTIQFSIEENQDQLIDQRLNEDDTKIILGDTCQSITFKYIPHLNYGLIEYVEAKYYFNPKYKLDEKMYAKHKISFWNNFVEMGKGAISVRNEILTYPLYRTTYEVIKILEIEIDDAEFELDKSKFIKEIE